jgi:hypothetical protein
LLSLTLFHRLSTTLCRESTAVDSLIASTAPTSEVGDGKRSAGAIDDATTPAPVLSEYGQAISCSAAWTCSVVTVLALPIAAAKRA